MSQTPYLPENNFSEAARVDPTRLDAELKNIADALASSQQILDSLVRDDSKLKDGLIRLFMLSTEVRNLMARVNPRGIWQPGQGYSAGDLVQVGDDSWLCYAAHVSSGLFDLDVANWVIFSRSLILDEGVVLGSAAFANIGVGENNLVPKAQLDGLYARAGKGGWYYETAANTHIIDPIGGSNRYSGTHTGSIEIAFPQGFKNAHVRLLVDLILEGTSGSQQTDSMTVMLTGKQLPGTLDWADMQAHILDGTDAAQIIPVRFGYGADGRPRIWLGELSTDWVNPSIKIRELLIDGNDIAAGIWLNNWNIAFVTAHETVKQTVRSAGVSQLPNFSGAQTKYLRVNPTGTGVEYRTGTQARQDIGALGEAPADDEGYIRRNGQWLPLSSYTFTIQDGRVEGDFELDGGIGGATMTIRADSNDDGDAIADMPQLRFLWDAAAKSWTANPDSNDDLGWYFNGTRLFLFGADGVFGAGNIAIVGNTIASINANGNINLNPAGSGVIQAIGPVTVTTGAFTVDREPDDGTAQVILNSGPSTGSEVQFRDEGVRRYSLNLDASDGFNLGHYNASGDFVGQVLNFDVGGDFTFSGWNAAGTAMEEFIRFDRDPNRFLVSKDTVLLGGMIITGDIRINKPSATPAQLLLDSDNGYANVIRFRNGTTSRYALTQTGTNDFAVQFFDASGSGEGNLYEYDEYGDTVFRGSNAAGDGLDEVMRFNQQDQQVEFSKPVAVEQSPGGLIPVHVGIYDASIVVTVIASSGITLTPSYVASAIRFTFAAPRENANYSVFATYFTNNGNPGHIVGNETTKNENYFDLRTYNAAGNGPGPAGRIHITIHEY